MFYKKILFQYFYFKMSHSMCYLPFILNYFDSEIASKFHITK